MSEKCVYLSVATTPSNVVVENLEIYLMGTRTPVSVINIGEHFDMAVYVSNTGGSASGVSIQVKIGESVIAGGTYTIGEYPVSSPMEIIFEDRYFGNPGTYTLCGIASGTGITTTQDCKNIEAVGEYFLEITEAPIISPPTVELGNPVTINVKYKNTGNIALPANVAHILITSNYQVIDDRAIGQLAPGATGTYNISWTATEAGTYSVCARVNYP
jgi:hypothetical protein